MEEWRDITGYEGKYQVSNLGRVKSLNYRRTGKDKVLKQLKNPQGYLAATLYRDGKSKKFLIHRLVAQAFLPNLDELPEINHKDENKKNNCVDNLEWCTSKYNKNYGGHTERRILTLKSNGKHCKKVKCIETQQVFSSCREASLWCNVTPQSLYCALKGRNRTTRAGGYHWEYI